MSDIYDRLVVREYADQWHDCADKRDLFGKGLMGWAADELDRLQAIVDAVVRHRFAGRALSKTMLSDDELDNVAKEWSIAGLASREAVDNYIDARAAEKASTP